MCQLKYGPGIGVDRNFSTILGFDPTSLPSKLNYSKVVMSKSYVIQWKSTVNGRTGRGTKLFDWEQAQELADELNQEYPNIQHEAAEASFPPEGAPANQSAERTEEAEPVEQPEAGIESSQVTHDPDPAMSFS